MENKSLDGIGIVYHKTLDSFGKNPFTKIYDVLEKNLQNLEYSIMIKWG